MIEKSAKIYVAGHNGLVGSAFVRKLHANGFRNLLLIPHKDLDLTEQRSVMLFLERERPDVIIDAAALVGGIKANSSHPSEFFYVNMQIEQNLIWSAFKTGVKNFLFLGSACMYPSDCGQPMREQYLLTGAPEQTNEGYALAKICGSRLCSYLYRQYGVNYISVIPANTYGIGDSFDPEHSHVIPALIMKFHKAKTENLCYVELWGSGNARREFIHTDDLADAGCCILNHYSSEEPINIGTGEEVTILELSELIKRIVGYNGDIRLDRSKPDGMARRVCDITKLNAMGWKSKRTLEEGITDMYQWYLSSLKEG